MKMIESLGLQPKGQGAGIPLKQVHATHPLVHTPRRRDFVPQVNGCRVRRRLPIIAQDPVSDEDDIPHGATAAYGIGSRGRESRSARAISIPSRATPRTSLTVMALAQAG